ncbi:MAG: C39 family peptidase [Bdellovibrionota bacterium]
MEIAHFTTPLSDKLCHALGFEFVREFISRARNKDDVVLNVPGYRQTKSYTCGFVSGLMVLHHFDRKQNAKKFYELCNPHFDWGMSTRKVASALRKKNIKVSIKKLMPFDELASLIEEGKPIITSIKRRDVIQHWVVIYGVNRKTKEVFVAGDKFWFSPVKTRMDWKSFRRRVASGADFLVCSKKN